VQTAAQPVYIAQPPPDADTVRQAAAAQAGSAPTEADKLRAVYQAAGEAQGHVYGQGYKPPDLLKLPASGSTTTPASAVAAPAGTTGAKVPPTSPSPAPPPAAAPATAPAAATAPKTVPNQRLANQAAGAQSGTSGH
jgi:hypothetical protein